MIKYVIYAENTRYKTIYKIIKQLKHFSKNLKLQGALGRNFIFITRSLETSFIIRQKYQEKKVSRENKKLCISELSKYIYDSLY